MPIWQLLHGSWCIHNNRVSTHLANLENVEKSWKLTCGLPGVCYRSCDSRNIN